MFLLFGLGTEQKDLGAGEVRGICGAAVAV